MLTQDEEHSITHLVRRRQELETGSPEYELISANTGAGRELMPPEAPNG